MEEMKKHSLQELLCLSILSLGAVASAGIGIGDSIHALAMYGGILLGIALTIGMWIAYWHYKKKLLIGATLVGMLIINGVLYKFLTNGAAICYNVLSTRVGGTYGINWKQLVIASDEEMSQFLFFFSISFWFTVLVTALGRLRKGWSKLVLFVLMIAVAFTMIFAQLVAINIWSGLALVAYIIHMLPEQNAKHWLRNHSLQIGILLVVAILFGIAFYAKEDEKALVMKNKLQNRWEELAYGNDQGVYGDLSKVSQIKKNKTSRLQVHLSEPGIVHLRSYVGGEYEGDWKNGKWSPLSDEAYTGKYLEMIDWLKEHNYQPLAAAATYGNFRPKDGKIIDVEVQHQTVNNKYFYLSENILPDSLNQFETVRRDENVRQHWYKKNIDYSFSIYNWTEKELLTEKADEYLSLNGKGNDELEPFYNGEVNYRRFAYEQYLGVPDKVTKSVSEWKQKQSGNLLAKVDAVRKKLESQEKQQSWNYASQGALLLRSLGVPTRYVEGYYISSDMGTDVELTDANMHAWVELYQDGIGWIAVEMTPGFYEEIEQETKTNMDNQNSSVDELENLDSNKKEEPKTEAHNWILYVIILVVLIAIIVVATRVRHYILWNHKNYEVRFRYYAKLLKKLLKKQHKLESDLPEDLWFALQAQAFGGQKLQKEYVEQMGSYIRTQKRGRRLNYD